MTFSAQEIARLTQQNLYTLTEELPKPFESQPAPDELPLQNYWDQTEIIGVNTDGTESLFNLDQLDPYLYPQKNATLRLPPEDEALNMRTTALEKPGDNLFDLVNETEAVGSIHSNLPEAALT